MSRPLIGSKPPSSADLAAEIASPSVAPRVVMGVPPSEPPPASDAPESLETKGGGSSAVDSALGRVVLPAEPKMTAAEEKAETKAEEKVEAKVEAKADSAPEAKAEEPAAQLDATIRDEQPLPPAQPTKKLASTLAFGSIKEEPASEPTKTAPRSFASTLAFGSSLADEVKKEDDAKVEAKVDLTKTLKIEEPKKAEEKKAEASTKSNKNDKKKKNKDAKAEAKAEQDKAHADATDADEISVPPIGDITVEKFFSDGDLSRHDTDHHHHHVEALTVPDKAKRKADPVVVQRRARFVRYVKIAVAGAAVVCLAAALRTTFSSAQTTSANKSVPTAAPKAAEPAAAPIAAEPTAAATATATAAPSAAEPTAPASASAAPEPGAPSPSASAAASADAPKEPVTGDAKEEKAKCRTALEKRKLADAIEAGEKSVALDPTDAEAWLLLGASHQEKGDLASARKAYASCVKEATTGPKYECGKMLR